MEVFFKISAKLKNLIKVQGVETGWRHECVATLQVPSRLHMTLKQSSCENSHVTLTRLGQLTSPHAGSEGVREAIRPALTPVPFGFQCLISEVIN